MERKYNDPPQIIKNPSLLWTLGDIAAENAVRVQWVIVPIRDYVEAANSRASLRGGAGGLAWGASGSDDQLPIYFAAMSVYLFHMAKHDPTIFLDFARMTTDPDYLYRALTPMMTDCGDSAPTIDQFREAFRHTADLSRPNHYLQDGERASSQSRSMADLAIPASAVAATGAPPRQDHTQIRPTRGDQRS